MRTKIEILLLITFLGCFNSIFGQRTDSSLVITDKADTFYVVQENIPKCKLLGNSWYTSLSYTLSKTNEFEFDFGRTYGSFSEIPYEDGITTRTYGAGYGLTSRKGEKTQILKLFWGYSYLFERGGTLGGFRIDYIYDIKNKTNYLRPSIGLSFIFIDIFYNYSIALDHSDNIFKHGVTFRINYFINSNNWYHTFRRKLNKNTP